MLSLIIEIYVHNLCGVRIPECNALTAIGYSEDLIRGIVYKWGSYVNLFWVNGAVLMATENTIT